MIKTFDFSAETQTMTLYQRLSRELYKKGTETQLSEVFSHKSDLKCLWNDCFFLLKKKN